MVSTVSATNDQSLLGAVGEDLALRVCGGMLDGQVVRLTSQKCTVGSGPRCTLRLRHRGVLPLHCLILRGAQSTVVRCLSRQTRLNGRAFIDAPLAPGDRITLGPVELEVLPSDVDGNSSPVEPPAEADTSSSLPTNTDRPTTEQHSAHEEQLQEIEKQRTELEAERQALQAEGEEWEKFRRKCKEELTRQTEEFERLREQVEQERRALEEERRNTERGDHAGAASDSPAPDSQPSASDAQNDPVARLAELRHIAQAESAGESISPSPEATLSEPKLSSQPSPEERAPDATPMSLSSADVEEESVEDYMAKLLQRAGGSANPETVRSVSKPSVRPAEPNKPEVPLGLQGSIEPENSEPFEMKRRLPPEMSSDLTAMRELANQSARSAIDKHTRTRWVRAAVGKITVTLTAMLVGSYLMISSPHQHRIIFLGAAVAAVVTLFWGLQSAIVLANIFKASRHAKKDQASRDSSQSSETSTPPVNTKATDSAEEKQGTHGEEESSATSTSTSSASMDTLDQLDA